VIRLYEEGGILANAQRVAARFAAGLEALRPHPLVGDVRYRGLLGALELVSDKTSRRGFDPALGLADRLFALGYQRGLVFRSFGDHVLGFAPALTITEVELDELFARLRRVLDDALEAPNVRAAMAGG
jgi:4-aminobutyrate--pyruvate transaminase